MKDFFFRKQLFIVLSFHTRFTFQFLTFHKPKKESIIFLQVSILLFNFYHQFYKTLELGNELRFVAASNVNELRL